MAWNLMLAMFALSLTVVISLESMYKNGKELIYSVIIMLVLVVFSMYSLVSIMINLGDYYIKDGQVRKVEVTKDELPRFAGIGDKNMYVSQFTKTVKNPYETDIYIDLTTKDSHNFNLVFKGKYYVIDDFTVNELQKMLGGEIENVTNFEVYQKDIEQAIVGELMKYTKDELNSKLFISEKLEKIQDDLMKRLPFKMKLYA